MATSQDKWKKLASDMLGYNGPVKYNSDGGYDFIINDKRYNVAYVGDYRDSVETHSVSIFFDSTRRDISEYLGDQQLIKAIHTKMATVIAAIEKDKTRRDIEEFIFG